MTNWLIVSRACLNSKMTFIFKDTFSCLFFMSQPQKTNMMKYNIFYK